MNWVTMILGGLLFLAPFLSGFSGQPGLLWFSLIAGAVIALLGGLKQFKWAAGAGLVVLVWPWIFGFAGTVAATWCWVIGAATLLAAGYQGFIVKRREQPTSNQLPHA